jgi:hypothetical protein
MMVKRTTTMTTNNRGTPESKRRSAFMLQLKFGKLDRQRNGLMCGKIN